MGFARIFATTADSQDGNLFWGDHITQLRFDPADAPALVDLDCIRVYTHCQN